jgi:hypothetical protein
VKANCGLRIDGPYQVLAEIGAGLRPLNTTFNGVSRLLHLGSNVSVERPHADACRAAARAS